MGMSLSVDVVRSYRNHNGRKAMCIRVVVARKGEKEYDSIHCYELNNGKISYSEGNRSMGVGDGILAYLGDNREVENYLEGLARYEAKNLLF